MFTPIPQITSAAVAPIPTSSALEFTEAEFEVVKKWMTLYTEADKLERYDLLKTKVLPRLFLLTGNTLPPPVWKERKSVSTQ
jgi:hypothetical protein